MRIARYDDDGTPRLAVVTPEGLRPLRRDADLIALLAAEPGEREEATASADDPIALEGTRLLAPLEPASFRDFITFEEHVEGVRKSVDGLSGVPEAWYDAPQFYFSNPHAVFGSGEDVPMPPGCELLDFELEVAAVAVRGGANLTPAEARATIGGYMILNDWSARDLQAREMKVGLGPAKGKDFANTFGPWVVTPDELEPYRTDDRLDLELEVFVNGMKIGDDTLANMSWSFDELIAYAARGTSVWPGDVFGSGTCGSGCLAELWGRAGRREPPPIVVGDVVTMTVEGIGTITNRVVAGAEAVHIPPARKTTRRVRHIA